MVIERATDGVAATASQGGRPPVLRRPRPLGRRRRRPRLRPRLTCASPSRTSSYTILAESLRGARGRHRRRGRARHGRRRSCRELLDEAGVDARPRPRRRHGPAGPDRPRDAARVALAARSCPAGSALDPAAEMEERLGLPVHARQRRERRRARRGRPSASAAARHVTWPICSLSAGIGAGPRSSTAAPSAGRAASPARSATSWSIPEGPICRCGNRGCLETFVAGPRAVRAAAPLARPA